MQNTTALQEAFKGMVGFFQFYNPEYPQLSTYLNQSVSGLYAQTTHPLCSIENIINSAPEFGKFEYPVFNSNTLYDVGSIAIIDDLLYKNTSNGWVLFKPFEEWLDNIYKSAVVEMLQDIGRIKRMNETSKQLIDSLKMYDGLGTLSDRIVNDDLFVGLEISVNNQEGLSILIDSIGMQLDSPANFNMYLFNANDTNYLKQIPCTFSKSGSFSWCAVKDLVLNYLSTDSNGVFWLGYFQSDLGLSQAVNRTTNWNIAPCTGCSEWNAMSYKKWSRHISVRGVSSATAPGKTLTGNPVYNYTLNHGINLSLTVGCDLTNVFIKNRYLLSNGLALKLSLKLLAEIAFTTRINVISDITKQLAMSELSLKDPDSFVNKYQNEIKALDFDFSGLSSDCLPCTSRKTLSYSSI